MTIHRFHSEIAIEYGVGAAILFYEVCYWVEYNKARNLNEINGKTWFYRSRKDFCRVHPYLSDDQIRTAFKKLKDAGLVEIDRFNAKGYDRTLWYTLGPNADRFLDDFESGKNGDSNVEKSQVGTLEKPTLLSGKTPEPIPIKETNKEKNLSLLTSEQETMFDCFWSAYPKKQGKQDAQKAFSKVAKDVWPCLVPAVEHQKKQKQWQNRQYIPLPATWLRGARWEDEPMESAEMECTTPQISDRFEKVTLPDGTTQWRQINLQPIYEGRSI